MRHDDRKKALCVAVGEFYLRINNNDQEAAQEEIRRIGFLRLDLFDDLIVMEVRRPGLLIGPRGERCQQIQDFLQARIDKFAPRRDKPVQLKIHIVEAMEVLEDYILRGAIVDEMEYVVVEDDET